MRAGGHDWALGQAYLTQRVGDLNKLLLVQLNHAFFFRTNISNDLDYIKDNFGNQATEIISNLRHVDDSTDPQDHEFLYVKDFLPVAVGYLQGNEIKFTKLLNNNDDKKIKNSEMRSMQENV